MNNELSNIVIIIPDVPADIKMQWFNKIGLVTDAAGYKWTARSRNKLIEHPDILNISGLFLDEWPGYALIDGSVAHAIKWSRENQPNLKRMTPLQFIATYC